MKGLVIISALALGVFAACAPQEKDSDARSKPDAGQVDDVASINNVRSAYTTPIEPLPSSVPVILQEQLQSLYASQEIVRLKADAVVANCIAEASTSTPTNPDLVIFINADKGFSGLQKVANCFTQDTGFTMAVETPEKLTQRFASEKNADIVIWSHDRFGQWGVDGLVDQITLSDSIKQSIASTYLNAVNSDGAFYGYPLALEGPVLVTNKALLTTPLASLEEVPLVANQLPTGIDAIAWKYSTTYFNRGFLFAGGGYGFKPIATGWDVNDSNVNDVTAASAANQIRTLIEGGYLDEDINQDGTEDSLNAAFIAGDVASVINGVWAFSDYAAAGVDFEISKYPTVGGYRAKPFAGVLTAGIASDSHYKVAAQAFIENYLLTEEGLAAINDQRLLGVMANIGLLVDTAIKNKRVAEYAAAMSDSVIMPNVPEMYDFWNSMANAVAAFEEGNDAQESLDDAQYWLETKYFSNARNERLN